jgi:mannose/fructose/N-acetylgalactosamine-specific phosphotransferase system component IIC
MLLGAILEIFHIATLPIGAARYPEAGTAAVSGAAAYLEATASLQVSYLLLATVFALAWERIAGASVVLVRRANEALVAEASAAADPARAITRRHAAAVVLDIGRGAVVSVTGALACAALLYALGPLWAVSPGIVRGVIGVSAVTILAAALVVFGGWRQRRVVFLLGIACGSLLSLLL